MNVLVLCILGPGPAGQTGSRFLKSLSSVLGLQGQASVSRLQGLGQ